MKRNLVERENAETLRVFVGIQLRGPAVEGTELPPRHDTLRAVRLALKVILFDGKGKLTCRVNDMTSSRLRR